MMYRDGQIEGTIDLNQYYYKNRSNAASFIMMDYKKKLSKRTREFFCFIIRNNKIIDIKVFKGYTKDKTFMIREST